MLARFALFVALAISSPVIATPVASRTCSGYALQCCNSVVGPISIRGQDTLIGFGCMPMLPGIGPDESPCHTDLVCCPDNGIAEVVSVGCVRYS
ncbi:hypothetical protein C8Q75DRAFT_502468 [Abortiporus biennis]|nr:hypothetical protein C8Q75DRAFT_502468 [Abortiporus biennis]